MNLADKMAEKVAPKIFDKVAPDLLNVLRSEKASDGKGGQRNSAFEKINRWEIPCNPQPRNISFVGEKSGERVWVQGYKIEFPRVYQGSFVDVKMGDRIQVLKRGLQPEMILTIKGLQSNSGVYWTASCLEESL